MCACVGMYVCVCVCAFVCVCVCVCLVCVGSACVCLYVSSPRMPHTLGEIFTHAQLLDFKTATAELGRARLACSSINSCTCAASQDPICAISAANAVANCG